MATAANIEMAPRTYPPARAGRLDFVDGARLLSERFIGIPLKAIHEALPAWLAPHRLYFWFVLRAQYCPDTNNKAQTTHEWYRSCDDMCPDDSALVLAQESNFRSDTDFLRTDCPPV
jgi:hypothetical protein